MPATPGVKAWIAEHAVPLKGAEPEIGLDDLAPLRDWIGDARVVGLGEATHGTREFFQLKHRMLELLVSELGFTLFTIEAAFPESLAVDRYVLTGEGDARHSVASMQPYCWDCEEMVAQVEWMRRWNEQHDRKLRFYGYDLQTSWPGVIFALEYLQERAPDAYARLHDPLQPLATDWWGLNWISRSDEEKQAAGVAIAETRELLTSLAASEPSAQDALFVRLHGEVLSQVFQLLGDSTRGLTETQRLRDRAMAENIAALLAFHGPDEKAVVWAHNGHVQLSTSGEFGFERGAQPMGEHLRELYGDDYVAVGFAFDHGSFSALDEARQMQTPSVSSTPGSLDAVLAEAAPPLAALNLRNVRDDVAEWFAEGPPKLDNGGLWYPGSGLEGWTKTDIREHYDVLLFVRETTPSRHNATHQIEWFRQEPATERLVNLDFTSGSDGWKPHAQPSPVGAYRFEAVEGMLELSRAEQLWPWDTFAVRQAVSAVPWRGKRITVRCTASVDRAHHGSSAQLGVRGAGDLADRTTDWATSNQMSMASFIWQRAKTIDAEPRELSLTVEVADDAEVFEIALVITGDGTARFGPVHVEAV